MVALNAFPTEIVDDARSEWPCSRGLGRKKTCNHAHFGSCDGECPDDIQVQTHVQNSQENRILVQEFLNHLEPEEAQFVILYFYDGHKLKEIPEKMGLKADEMRHHGVSAISKMRRMAKARAIH